MNSIWDLSTDAQVILFIVCIILGLLLAYIFSEHD